MPWGEGRIFRRGRIWWLAYYCNGEEIRESSHSDNPKVARKALRDRLARLSSGSMVPHEASVRYEDLEAGIIEDYQVNARRSLTRMKAALIHLRAFFRGVPAMRIGLQQVQRYILDRKEHGAANATINRELAALKRMFRIAVDCERLGKVPFIPMLVERNARQGFFDDASFRAVLDRLPEELRGYFRFLYLSGWRSGEARALQWRDVDWEGRVIRLRHEFSKNGQSRTLAFAGELLAVMEGARSRRRLDCVFVFHSKGKALRHVSAWIHWRRACREAGQPGRLIHDLRRTALRNLIRSGTSQSVAMAISGHKTIATFQRYNITSEADLVQAQERLAQYLALQRTHQVSSIVNRTKEQSDET